MALAGKTWVILVLVALAAELSLCAEQPRSWRFMAACDTRGIGVEPVNTVIFGEIAQRAVIENVEFLLFAGDLVSSYASTPQQFEEDLNAWVDVLQPLYDANIPVYVGRGNHELPDVWDYYPYGGATPDPNDNGAIRWHNVFGNDARPKQKLPENGPDGEKHMTYSVTHRNALIIMLDQYAGDRHDFLHSINQQWLDDQLASNTKPHIFVAGHEEAFRQRHGDCMDYRPAERDIFWKSLADAGCRAYFCGHDHYFDHTRILDTDSDPSNDVHHFVTATAGAPLYTWSPPFTGDNSYWTPQQIYHDRDYGYVLVDVGDLNVTLTWVRRDSTDSSVPGSYEPAYSWSYTAIPKPRILSPNGGENLTSGLVRQIAWKTTDDAEIDYVRLEYSLDFGQSWRTVAITENTGFYDWLVPPADSNQCLLRVSDLLDPTAADVSDNPFVIFQCTRRIAGDLNGDCYVDIRDLTMLLDTWLDCANPFDPHCDNAPPPEPSP